MTKIKELREKNKNELGELLRGLQGKLHDLRFQLKTGKMKNVHVYSAARRDIARVRTIVNEQK